MFFARTREVFLQSTAHRICMDVRLTRPNQLRPNHLRPAMTLLEMIIVLVITVAMFAFSMVVIRSMLNISRATDEARTITQLATAVRKVKTFSTAGYTSDAAILAAIVNLGLLPPHVSLVNNTISNPWGGAITFSALDNGASVGITYANVPADICPILVMSVPAGFLLTVNSGTPGFASNITSIFSLTTSQIATICKAANGTISWTSRDY